MSLLDHNAHDSRSRNGSLQHLSDSLGRTTLANTKRRPPPPLPPRSTKPRKPVASAHSTQSTKSSHPSVSNGTISGKVPAEGATSTNGATSVTLPSTTVAAQHGGRETINGNTQSQVFIGVVGVTGSGKSSFIHRVTGCETVVVADGLHAGTRDVNQAALHIGSTTVNLVDTPGFNDTELEDEDIYYKLVDWLRDFHKQGQRFSGLLYLFPVNKTRQKGSDVRSLKVFQRLVGRENFHNVVIGITFHDVESPDVVAARELELSAKSGHWAEMINAGASVIRIPFDKEGCIALLAKMAGENTAMTLRVERELFEENRTNAETSAMQEMQDHTELKIMQVREEMEMAAQQMLFDEQVRLTSQFSNERAELERRVFELEQEKQSLQGQALMWENSFEQELEHARALKLQHENEERSRKQRKTKKRREEETKAEREKTAQVKEDLARTKEIDYANSQITKMLAYKQSKFKVFDRLQGLYDVSKIQQCKFISLSNVDKGTFAVGTACVVCWTNFQYLMPLLIFTDTRQKNNPDFKSLVGVCTTESCMSFAKKVLNPSVWDQQWSFPLIENEISCKRTSYLGTSLVCSICYGRISGFYAHCCECDDDDFDLCAECWLIKYRGCKEREEHHLKFAMFWDMEARFKMIEQ